VLAAGVVAPRRRGRAVEFAPAALLAAVGFGVIAQGGFYSSQLAILGILVAVAAMAAGLSGVRHPAVLGAAGLAGTALVSGVVAGDVGGSWPTVGLLGCAAGAVVASTAISAAERETLISWLLVAAVIVSALAWTGVAFHVQPLALVDGGLWRGASGLTYANATAAFLIPLGLVGLARVAEGRHEPGHLTSGLTYLILLGAASTLSRGGAISLAAGMGALMLILGWRRCISSWAPVILGTIVALAGLAVSMPSTSRAQPLLATGAVALGALITWAGARLPDRLSAGLLLGVVLVVPFLVMLTPGRWTAASPDRSHATSAALAVFAGSPLLGVSPGHYLLTWNDPTLGPRFIYYAHDEYLQLAGELGLIGIGVAATAAFGTGRRAWRSRSRTAAWAGPAAALLALAVHSGFDFLWHIPLIVVLMGVLIGLVTSPDPTSQSQPAQSHQAQSQ
jgi:hypothetical protein